MQLARKKTSLEFTATNTQMTTIWRQAKEKGSALIVYISSTARFESGVTAGGAALFCIPTPTTAKGPVPFTFLWISQIPRGSLFGGFRFLWPFDLPRSLWFLGCSFALRLSLWLSLWLASNLGLGGGRGGRPFLPFLSLAIVFLKAACCSGVTKSSLFSLSFDVSSVWSWFGWSSKTVVYVRI